jgi:hypothetical protein
MKRSNRFKDEKRWDPVIGDKIKIGTGRQIWTIIHITESTRIGEWGNTFLNLVNPEGTRQARCYLGEAKPWE